MLITCYLDIALDLLIWGQGFRELGRHDWSLMHAFYADMGGFVLDGPGIKSPFPVDAQQLLFLVRKGYVQYTALPEEDIADRNKSDGVARCLAVAQASWMVVNCVVRVVQGLALTTLELTTLSFILIFFITSFCWYYKPSGITTRVTIHLETHIDQVLTEVCLLSQHVQRLAEHIKNRAATRQEKNGIAHLSTSSTKTFISASASGATTLRSCSDSICPSSRDRSQPYRGTVSPATASWSQISLPRSSGRQVSSPSDASSCLRGTFSSRLERRRSSGGWPVYTHYRSRFWVA